MNSIKNGTNLLLIMSLKNCKQYSNCANTFSIFHGQRRDSISIEISFCSMSIVWLKFRSIVNWNKQTTEFLKIFLWLYKYPECCIQLMTSWTVTSKRTPSAIRSGSSHKGHITSLLAIQLFVVKKISSKGIQSGLHGGKNTTSAPVALIAVRTALVWWTAALSERYIQYWFRVFSIWFNYDWTYPW